MLSLLLLVHQKPTNFFEKYELFWIITFIKKTAHYCFWRTNPNILKYHFYKLRNCFFLYLHCLEAATRAINATLCTAPKTNSLSNHMS